MKYKVLAVFLALFFLGLTNAEALDTSNVYAYPVPFNPKYGVKLLKVNTAGGSGYRTNLYVYDINGDLVFSRSYGTGDAVQWNGRNSRGGLVKPGLYVVKVILEDDATGDYGKKLLRILVKY